MPFEKNINHYPMERKVQSKFGLAASSSKGNFLQAEYLVHCALVFLVHYTDCFLGRLTFIFFE